MSSLNRREFLNTASSLAAGGVAINLASRVHAAEAESDKRDRPPVKLAVMGVNSRLHCGREGVAVRWHARDVGRVGGWSVVGKEPAPRVCFWGKGGWVGGEFPLEA